MNASVASVSSAHDEYWPNRFASVGTRSALATRTVACEPPLVSASPGRRWRWRRRNGLLLLAVSGRARRCRRHGRCSPWPRCRSANKWERRPGGPWGRLMSTMADLLSATGQFCWPPVGNYLSATGQFLMAGRQPTTPRMLTANSRSGDPTAAPLYLYGLAQMSANARFGHLPAAPRRFRSRQGAARCLCPRRTTRCGQETHRRAPTLDKPQMPNTTVASVPAR
jgi:hypothetical protein